MRACMRDVGCTVASNLSVARDVWGVLGIWGFGMGIGAEIIGLRSRGGLHAKCYGVELKREDKLIEIK
jgi:hypothetical protein